MPRKIKVDELTRVIYNRDLLRLIFSYIELDTYYLVKKIPWRDPMLEILYKFDDCLSLMDACLRSEDLYRQFLYKLRHYSSSYHQWTDEEIKKHSEISFQDNMTQCKIAFQQNKPFIDEYGIMFILLSYSQLKRRKDTRNFTIDKRYI